MGVIQDIACRLETGRRWWLHPLCWRSIVLLRRVSLAVEGHAVNVFYRFLLWATRLELAVALSLPNRNHDRIRALQADESSYDIALTRLELGL